MIDWDLMGDINHKCSGSKEIFIDELVSNTNADLQEFVTGFDVKIRLDHCRETVTVTKKHTREQFVIPALMEAQAGKDMIQNSLVRLFRFSNEYDIETGDYVTYTPNNGSCGERTYIVISNIEPHVRYCSAYVFECSNYYNTYNKQGEIVPVYFYTDDNKLIMRDTNVKVIRNEDIGTIMITLPDTEVTRMLGDEQKRILVDGNAFKIIGVSFVNGVKGNLTVMIQIDALNDKDDLINGIAYNEDVLDNIEQPEQDNPITVVEITGSDDTCLRYTETYTINTDEVVVWSVDNTYVTLTSNGNSCDIYVQNKKSLIGKTIVLTAEVNGVIYKKNILIGE